MHIIIDKREHSLYEKIMTTLATTLQDSSIQIIQKELFIGDILLQTDDNQDILLIERKSFSDLLSSIKDGRYEEQSHRLLNTSELPPHSIIYLLEGMFSTIQNPKDKKMIYSSITTLNYFKGFSVFRTSNTAETAEWILSMADKLNREFKRGKEPYYFSTPFLTMYQKIKEKSSQHVPDEEKEFNTFTTAPITPSENNNVSTETNYCNFVKKVKKDNITPENIGEIILCQIPGISSVTAITIMKQFGTFPMLISELQKNPQCLDGMVCESSNGKSRKISKSSLENIRKFLT